MHGLFRRLKDTLRYWFYQTVETAFTVSNKDKALVLIRPGFLARVWNDLETSQFYMQRSVNRNNRVCWTAEGPKGSKIIAHKGMIIFKYLEAAYKKNLVRLDNMPDPLPPSFIYTQPKYTSEQEREEHDDDAN